MAGYYGQILYLAGTNLAGEIQYRSQNYEKAICIKKKYRNPSALLSHQKSNAIKNNYD